MVKVDNGESFIKKGKGRILEYSLFLLVD